MSVLYVLVPIAVLFVGAAIAAFVWAARQGQFDDLSTPSFRAVVDDEDVPANRDDRPRPGNESSRDESLPNSERC